MWIRLYTLPPDPSPYEITTHPSGYHAQCRPGYTPDPRRCSQWFSRTAECPAPSWVGRPVQLARGWSGHCTGLTELRNLIYSNSYYTGNYYITKTRVLPLFHSPYPDVYTPLLGMQETFKMFIQGRRVHIAASAGCLFPYFFLLKNCCHSCNGTFRW